MTDREQEAAEPDWDKIAQDALDRHREVHGATYVVGSAAAVAKAGAEWADAHRSTEPPADAREALRAMVYETMPDRGSHITEWPSDEVEAYRSAGTNTLLGKQLARERQMEKAVDAILAAGFRVVPLGAEPDEDNWEYSAGYEGRNDMAGRWFSVSGHWYKIREAAERDVDRYVDSQVTLIRRRKPGTPEPVNPRGENQ